MIDLFAPVAEFCAIEIPRAHRLPIAIVGAGAIVATAHLPAYRSAGLEIAGITDIDPGRAREVASRFGVPVVYRDLDELLADERVRVVDVAVPSQAQPEIARRVLRSGRHMLGQKPFAPDAGIARELADLAADRGLVLAVNQQLRFDEGIAATYRMAELGWIGDVTAVTFDVDIDTDFASWDWLREAPRLEIMYHSIHYHDAVRWLLGQPESVFCAAGREAGQRVAGETWTVSTYTYASGARALVHSRHANRWGDQSATFRVEGTRGAIRGTLGMLYDYPHGRPDTLAVRSEVIGTDGWVPYPVTTRWIPDAFAGPVASLLAAVATGGEPRSPARDNVGTLRLVEALYESSRAGTSVGLGP
ncbi:MAG: Gfo/Idh/MocA family oxidoreductase [Nocardiopsaceae bacterium]|nr:Gfo/Idh/MocA family oxidoreductase [Nocardiopsaceae bacterium]